LKVVGLARQTRYFFLRSQEKVSKKKATLIHLLPALLSFMDGNRTRPDKPQKLWLVAELKHAITEDLHEASATRRG
jgi:hypothetical protein